MDIAVQKKETDLIKDYWEKLSTLSLKAKLQLASLLTTAAFQEESLKYAPINVRREAKVKRRSAHSPSDAELESRFAGKEVPALPEDPLWSQVISANTGKTIKSIEKWL